MKEKNPSNMSTGVWGQGDIVNKIKLWMKRIDQFELLGEKEKTTKMYHELAIMMRIHHLQQLEELGEKKRSKELQSEIKFMIQNFHEAVKTGNLNKVLNEVDLTEKSIDKFDQQQLINSRDILFTFYSDDESLEKVRELTYEKFDLLPLDPKDKINMDIALGEAIGNAQRHGHKFNQEMIIKFHYIRMPDCIILKIVDQGEGFDFESVLNKKKKGDPFAEAVETYTGGKYGGLGLMMILKCMDKVEFNKKGNQITLTKNLLKTAKEEKIIAKNN